MFKPVVITFTREGTPYWIDLAFCVSMKISDEKLICSFVNGQEFTFHQDFMIQYVQKAFKLAKGMPMVKNT